MTRSFITLTFICALLTACASTPEPVAAPITIKPDPVRTCFPLADLKKVVIPAKTKTYTVVSLIENPPYDPIEREETFEREVSPAIIYFVDDTGAQVTDICEEDQP